MTMQTEEAGYIRHRGGKTAECEIYDKNALLAASVKAIRNKNTVNVTVSGTDKPFTVESAQGLDVVIK